MAGIDERVKAGSTREGAVNLARELHDIAQPLCVLQGMLELALRTSRTREHYRHACQRALWEAQRAVERFNNLQEAVRGGAAGVSIYETRAITR